MMRNRIRKYNRNAKGFLRTRRKPFAMRLYDFLGLQRLTVSLKHDCAKRIVDTF